MKARLPLPNEDLLEIYPAFFWEGKCPKCGNMCCNDKEVLYLGLHYLGQYECKSCGEQFFKTLPQGHGSVFPITFSKDLRYVEHSPRAKGWLAEPLLKSMSVHQSQEEAGWERIILHRKEKVIVVNCLDTCYGHIFYKVVSILYYQKHYPDYGIIAILPKSVAWLCPNGVSEQWLIDLPVRLLDRKLSNFDAFVRESLSGICHVYIATQYMNPDFKELDFEKILHIPKFDLDTYTTVPYTVSLVLREDRFWFANKLDRFLWKVCLKLRVGHRLKGYFVFKQNLRFNKLARLLALKFPNIRIYATGIGKSGTLGGHIQDLREPLVGKDPMEKWSAVYAQSHVIVGTHGSNLLVPTALAAGFVEICTEDKICHISEEIAMVRHPKYMHFLGRFVDETCSVRLLYKHLYHMLADFESIKIKY